LDRLYDKATKKERAAFWKWAAAEETDPKLKARLEEISAHHNPK